MSELRCEFVVRYRGEALSTTKMICDDELDQLIPSDVPATTQGAGFLQQQRDNELRHRLVNQIASVHAYAMTEALFKAAQMRKEQGR